MSRARSRRPDPQSARTSRLLAAALAVATALVAGCAVTAPRRPTPAPDLRACVALFERTDAAVARERVGDALATPVAGFAHLRVDRLLASFRDGLGDGDARRFWLSRLAALDADARAAELANLSRDVRAELLDVALEASPGSSDVASALDRCRATLVAADLADPDRFAALRRAAVVPDDYSTARRVVGFYALTRIPFAAGVRAFEREIERVFALPLDALPRRGRLLRYTPAAAGDGDRRDVAATLRAAASNPLGIPYPDAPTLRRLAESHAPTFEIDVESDDDRIGTPTWPARGAARIDVARPTVFFRAAHTRVAERVLLQLVYSAWFPARPPEHAFDLLAGDFDALVWRVTLAADGEPLLYDSIHMCGCYHFFFPTVLARPRPAPRALDEWRFVPEPPLPRTKPGERIVLRVAARTHYLQRVLLDAGPRAIVESAQYALVPDDTLRSLPRPDGDRRSLFGADGFVAGSERAERFWFWPMGIANAGAMRQWGRHATAFVGRRHFDDPRLIDERFELAQPRETRR